MCWLLFVGCRVVCVVVYCLMVLVGCWLLVVLCVDVLFWCCNAIRCLFGVVWCVLSVRCRSLRVGGCLLCAFGVDR